MKVFCSNCKYGDSHKGDTGFWSKCKITIPDGEDYYDNRYVKELDQQEVNKNNDCKYYKPDWSTRRVIKKDKVERINGVKPDEIIKVK